MSRRRDRDRSGARSLHVRGYEVQGTGDQELRGVFEAFGQVLDVYLPKDHYTKELRGFAYIQFSQEADAEEARRKLDRTDVFNDGRPIHIMWAAGERKTPHDMRRLDVLRDNPHARRARIEQGGEWPRSPPHGRGGKRYRSPSPRYDRRRDDRSPYRRGGGRRGRSRSPYRRDFRSPPRYGRRSRSRSPHRRRGDRSPPPYRRHSPRRRDPRDARSPGREYSRSPPVPRRGDSGDRRDRGDSRSPYRRESSRSPAPKRRATSRSPRRRSNSPGGWRKADPKIAPSGNTSNGIVENGAGNGNHHDGAHIDGGNGDPRSNGGAKMDERAAEEVNMEPVGDNYPK